MEAAAPSWHRKRDECDFALFGYPRKHADIEYGARTSRTESQQWLLQATYRGRSELPNCHTLVLRETGGIEDLDGLSGSPVFALEAGAPDAVRALFAGLVLRGTAASGLVHFLCAEAILAVLDEILLRPRAKLPKRWWGGETRLRRRPSVHE